MLRRDLPATLRQALVAALSLVTLSGTPLAAHDFWIEPADYAPPAGAPLALRLRVGDGFAGEPLPRDPAHLERFVAIGATGELEVGGAAGVDPAGFLTAPPGAWVVVYRSRPGELVLDGEVFARYLAEEGLETIQAERERRGEDAGPARERFSRCAKALLRIGEGGGVASVLARPVRLPLEIVPEGDPTRRAGPHDGERIFRLLHEGEPLAGALVAALPAGRPADRVAARTDAAGEVRLPIAGPGPWLVKAVHMLPAGDGSADWESLWASLTFAVAE